MKLGPRERVIITIVVVAVVVVAMIAFLIWPQIQRSSQIEAQISSAKDEMASAQALLASREQSKSKAAETDAKWLRLASLVPDGPDLPSLIVELQDAAFDSGVQILGVTPSTPVPYTSYYSIPMKVQILGTWADTVDYLQRLMTFNRGLRIVDSSSSRVNNSDVQTTENTAIPDYSVKTTIDVEAYMIPSASPSSSATVTPPTTSGQ